MHARLYDTPTIEESANHQEHIISFSYALCSSYSDVHSTMHSIDHKGLSSNDEPPALPFRGQHRVATSTIAPGVSRHFLRGIKCLLIRYPRA